MARCLGRGLRYGGAVNWDDYRFFLAVARAGSLTAAARALRVSQPTVGRRIAALERRLGATLFVRTPAGFALSAAGIAVREHAARIELDVLGAEGRVTGRDAGVRGVVRVTASEWLCTSVLAPIAGELVARHPELELELVADTRHLDLARREADLAIRPARFAQQAVIARAVGEVAFGLYAAPRYLAARGLPQAGDGRGHVQIGMLDGVGDVARAWLARVLPRATRSLRTNGRDAMARLAVAGAGLACLARVVGDAEPRLARVELGEPAPAVTLWLGMAKDARATPRVRTVARHFAARLGERLAA